MTLAQLELDMRRHPNWSACCASGHHEDCIGHDVAPVCACPCHRPPAPWEQLSLVP